MGRARLEAELAAKGFDAGTTARTLDAVYGDRREADMAEALLGRTSARRARSAAQQAALLRRHGFSEDTIEQMMGTEGSW
jgi:SOS response regulatory protein OraA/RecX